MPSPGTQYDPKTDQIVYRNPLTRDFTQLDWLRLALAALDQAGSSKGLMGRVEEQMADLGVADQ